MNGVRFYCGISETKWNHHPVQPGPYACISPVTGRSIRTAKVTPATVPSGTEVIQDSGAFSDSWVQRLTFDQALERQQRHAERYKYADKITHRASYDLLIDEVWEDGNRHKRRWTESAAVQAVDETVAAAEFAVKHRGNNTGLVLSAQGVTASQYLGCVQRITPLLEPDDILGLGGWCIIGKMPKVMMPVFRETIREVIPFAARQGVKWVHIWGVIYPKALGELLWIVNEHGLRVSTDSAGPSRNPAFGEWGYGNWRNNAYERAPVETRGLERARHVEATRQWLECLHVTQYHRQSPMPAPLQQMQLPLFG